MMTSFIIKPPNKDRGYKGEWSEASLLARLGKTPGERQLGRIYLQDVELKSKINTAERMGDIPAWEILMAKWERWQKEGVPASVPGPDRYTTASPPLYQREIEP